jgi:hypothetical protein
MKIFYYDIDFVTIYTKYVTPRTRYRTKEL